MIQRTPLLASFAVACAAVLPHAAHAQALAAYPQHAVEIVVPYAAGGGADVMARAFAASAVKHFPQPLVVVNKTGAAGVIGWTDVINAKPDGYKLALTTVEVTFLNYLGLAKFGWDELVPIAKLNGDPAVLVVRADGPYATLEQFLAAGKKSDANIRIGNAGTGSMWHLSAVALADKAGATLNHIPFAGGNPAIQSLLGGHIDAVIASAPEVAANVQAGKLRALGVMANKRAKGFEDVPTMKERNYDLVLGTWRGLAVPKGTPPEVITVLKDMAAKTMQEPALREIMDKQNFNTDSYEDQATFQASMARESAYIQQIAVKVDLKK
jgi:tripartite-type tricarboxylate transporter receptor subunit TctC